MSALPLLDREIIDKIVAATTAQEAWIALRSTLTGYGFQHVLYGTNRLSGAGILGRRADTAVLSDLPEPMNALLLEQELFRTAPVAIWASRNNGAMSFRYGSDLYHGDALEPQQRQTQEVLMQAGVTSGYILGFNSPSSTIATIMGLINLGMTQEDADDIWAAHGKNIWTYAAVFNLRMASLPLPASRPKLTARQQEVLRWIAHGKTSAEVATILGLSTATIEKHLRQARETLGVSTTTQAVLFAQINSHIFTRRSGSDAPGS